jgi:hypothetical protein
VNRFSFGMPLVLIFENTNMADNKKNTGRPDRDRISLSQEYEVRDWSKKFGVSEQALKDAVKAVGADANKVEAYLKQGTK